MTHDEPRRFLKRDDDCQNPSLGLTQVERIFLKFGGARRLARLLEKVECKRTYGSVYKWSYPKSRGGSGGLIPQNIWPYLFEAARLDGVVLTADDFDPRIFDPKPKFDEHHVERDVIREELRKRRFRLLMLERRRNLSRRR